MNNLGYSIDNLHIGDTFIKSGDLEVDGDLLVGGNTTINEISVNELNVDGYKLPTSAGTDGQVLTMNPDNTTTSFKDITGGVARVWQNVYSMRSPTLGGSKTGDIPITSGGIGSQTLAVDDIPIDSNLKFSVNGLFFLNRNVVSDFTKVEFKLYITQNAVNNIIPIWDCTTSQAGTPITPVSYRGGYWNLVFYLTRISSTTLRLASVCCNTNDMQDQDNLVSKVSNSLQNPAFNLPYDITITPSGNIQFQIQTRDLSQNLSTSSVIAQQYTIDLCSNSTSILATSENLTTDHLLLSNLQGGPNGDGGHSQFTMLNGRSGGQVISGGLTPLHELKLKAHIGGVDNVIIKDLNTEFSKPIDMSSNNIINAKDIIDSFGNKIDMNTGGFLSSLEISSADEVKLLNTTNNNFISMSNAGTNITSLTGSLNINHALGGNTIDMYNTGLFNALTLISNTAGVYLQQGTGGTSNNLALAGPGYNQNTNSGVTTIRNTDVSGKIEIIKTGGGLIELVSPSGVEAVIDSNVVKINGTEDIALPVTIGVPSGSFRVVQGGAYINKSLQVDEVIYCPSINGLTPVGGLSSGTSNSALLTASTAEQSILALTFVGGRQAPANTFKVGDAYTATLAGEFSSNNGDTLTLRLKGGTLGTTVLSSLVVPLNGSSSVYYELEINLVIRAIGAAGVADLVINYDFSYNQASGGNFQGERKCEINNTTFDSTVLNQLDITAQFSSSNAGNSIQTLLSTLGKTY